jgi:hypothetical protein
MLVVFASIGSTHGASMEREIDSSHGASVAREIDSSHGAGVARELGLPDLLWNRIDHLLNERVHDGLVRYERLNEDGPFRDAWGCLTGVTLAELESWHPEEQIAFWINAYNLATLKLIADHYPIKGRFPLSLIFPDNSILMIPGRWKGNLFPIAGKQRTLDEIEHEILRKEFDEPRIHFAIVCASLGCPILRGEAYRGSHLDQQLEEQARTYFARPSGLRIEGKPSRPKVKLTKILKWFGEDFDELEPDLLVLQAQGGGDAMPEGRANSAEGTPPDGRTQRGKFSRRDKHAHRLAVVARWFPAEARELVRARRVRLGWIGYDWELNDWRP